MSGWARGGWTNSHEESGDKDVLVEYKYLSPQGEREHQFKSGTEEETQS